MPKSIKLPKEIVKSYDIDVPKLLGTTALAGLVVGVVIFDLILVSKLSQVVSLELRSPVQNPFVLVTKPAQEMYVRTTSPSVEVEQTSDLFDKYFGEEADIARAVAMAESKMNSQAINHSDGHGVCRGSFGTMQIACIHTERFGVELKDLLDEETNIRIASEIWKEQGWTPWGAYTSGSYKKYL